MRAFTYKLFIKIILLTIVFALNSFTLVAMPEPETLEEKTPLAKTSQQFEDNKTIEDENLTVSQQEGKEKQVEVTESEPASEILPEVVSEPASEAVAVEVDSTDKQDTGVEQASSKEVMSNQIIEDSQQAASDKDNIQDHGLVIENSYISVNPGDNAAAYLTIKNTTDADIRLVEVKTENSELIKKIEIHNNRLVNKVVKMVHQKNGFKVKANSELQLKEGKKHIMLFGVDKDFFDKEKNLKLTLRFMNKDKSSIEVLQVFDIKQFKCKKCCHKSN